MKRLKQREKLNATAFLPGELDNGLVLKICAANELSFEVTEYVGMEKRRNRCTSEVFKTTARSRRTPCKILQCEEDAKWLERIYLHVVC